MSRFGGCQINGDRPELLLTELRRTCMSCPAQWEARILGDHGYLYIRCRHSRFSVRFDPSKVNPNGHLLINGSVQYISRLTLGYTIDDEPNTAEMLKMIGGDLVTQWG